MTGSNRHLKDRGLIAAFTILRIGCNGCSERYHVKLTDPRVPRHATEIRLGWALLVLTAAVTGLLGWELTGTAARFLRNEDWGRRPVIWYSWELSRHCCTAALCIN